MSIKSAIKLPIGVPVRIEPLTLDLIVRDMPGNNTYAKVYIPKSKISGNTTVGEDDHPTPLNVPVWKEYVNRVMFDDHVMLSLHGKTEQHLGELHSIITMDKDVKLNGKSSPTGWPVHSNNAQDSAVSTGSKSRTAPSSFLPGMTEPTSSPTPLYQTTALSSSK